jgi:uncharacterized protein
MRATTYNSDASQTTSSMRPFANHNPLTDAQIERLDSFLRKNKNAMNLEEIDGFFTALVCGPELVMPIEYLPHVWGKGKSQDGIFRNLDQAQEILGLLNRHWNTIAKTLYEGEAYVPLMHEDENGSMTGNEWAKGFLRGMGLRRDTWNQLLDDEEHGRSLVSVFMLAHEHDPDTKFRRPPISSEKRQDVLTRLAAGVTLAYRYFRPKHRAHAKA